MGLPAAERSVEQLERELQVGSLPCLGHVQRAARAGELGSRSLRELEHGLRAFPGAQLDGHLAQDERRAPVLADFRERAVLASRETEQLERSVGAQVDLEQRALSALLAFSAQPQARARLRIDAAHVEREIGSA